jgi:Fe-Mn family superoxide dismutase
MNQPIAPIQVRPWTLNGMSERLIVSHYENNYGGAVRTLNAVRAELAALDARAPGYRVRALKREELIAMGSVTLHELYFGNLGGEGHKVPDQVGALLEEHFGSATAWRRDFHVGCNITRALRERGYDARFIRGGVSAWYAAGGPRALRPGN